MNQTRLQPTALVPDFPTQTLCENLQENPCAASRKLVNIGTVGLLGLEFVGFPVDSVSGNAGLCGLGSRFAV